MQIFSRPISTQRLETLAFQKRMFREASAVCVMRTGGEEDCSHMFSSASLPGHMGQQEDPTGGCHIKRGFMGLSNEWCLHEDDRGEKALSGVLGKLAAP